MTKSWRAPSLGASVESNEVQAAECEWGKNLCHQVILLQNAEGNEHLFGKKKICWEYDVPSLPVAELLWRNLLPPRLAVGLAVCP